MKIGFAALALAATLAAPGLVQAKVFDAFAMFDGSNPTGPFTYIGYSGGVAQNPALMSAPAACGYGSTCVSDASDSSGFYKAGPNTPAQITQGGSTVTVPFDRLIVQPDFLGATVIFYAPRTAAYTFSAVFNGIETLNDGVTIVRAAQGIGNVLVGPANTVPNNRTYSETINMVGGRWAGFFIGPGQRGGYDLTSLKLEVSGPVPEPGAWALMITGFGLAGMGLRRRLRTAAA